MKYLQGMRVIILHHYQVSGVCMHVCVHARVCVRAYVKVKCNVTIKEFI